ncbi:FAD-binding oxidoreductase [Rothia sp. CCM 9417]|uniref:FAD-binding oxidoreductase n=1 Tax=Rothia sp. CCM 9417 TaxID=3402657 RepID=UPI003AE8F66B
MSALLQELVQSVSCTVLTDPTDFDRYPEDDSEATPELPLAVLLAESTQDVSTALAWANRHGVKVSVRGAGSGLAGGAVAYAGGLVLSVEKMTSLSLDPLARLAVVGAGVITADLDRAAQEHGLFFPPDPASAAISTVGGNIATNAGGLRCLAHGVTADSVVALEVVLADGSVIHTGARTAKNVTGLNLTQLFVGSEGTLGVITQATVRLKPVPEGDPATFSAHFDSFEEATDTIIAIASSQEKPESLELVDAETATMIEKHHSRGLTIPKAAIVMGKTTGPRALEQAQAFAQRCAQGGAIETAALPGLDLMETRRLVHSATIAEGYLVFGDTGVPLEKLSLFVAKIRELEAEYGRKVTISAHAGDGNLHPAVYSADGEEGQAQAHELLDRIGLEALKLGGTVTGEHGIGSLKMQGMLEQLSPATLAAQRAIKAALDPNNILTPGRAV